MNKYATPLMHIDKNEKGQKILVLLFPDLPTSTSRRYKQTWWLVSNIVVDENYIPTRTSSFISVVKTAEFLARF